MNKYQKTSAAIIAVLGLSACASSAKPLSTEVITSAQKTVFSANLNGVNQNNSKNPSSDGCKAAKPRLPYFDGLCTSGNTNNKNTGTVVYNGYQNAWGRGYFVLDEANKTLTFNIRYGGLSGPPIMAHFHVGTDKQAGPIIQTLCGPPPATGSHHHGSASSIGFSAAPLVSGECPYSASGQFSGVYPLNGQQCDGETEAQKAHHPCVKITVEQQIEKLKAGDVYLNFHTLLNQPGEIRGQLIAQ